MNQQDNQDPSDGDDGPKDQSQNSSNGQSQNSSRNGGGSANNQPGQDDDDDIDDGPNQQQQDDNDNDNDDDGGDDNNDNDNQQQQQGGRGSDSNGGDSFDEDEVNQTEAEEDEEDEIAYNGQPGTDVDYDETEERFDDEHMDEQDNQQRAAGQTGYGAGQSGYNDAGQPGYNDAGQDGYGPGQDGYGPGQDGHGPGQDGYGPGQDGYGPGPGQDGYDAPQGAYDAAGQSGYNQGGGMPYDQNGQVGYSQGQPYGPNGQPQPYNQYGQPGQPGQPQGPPYDQYGQSQPYNQYGQPGQYGEADPYAHPQADPYGSRVPPPYYGGAPPPEQARPMPEKSSRDDEVISKTLLATLIFITCLLVGVVVVVVALLIVFLDDDETTPAPAPVPPVESAPSPTLPTPTIPASTTPAPTDNPPTTSPVSVPVENEGWQSSSENTFSASRSGAGFGKAIAVAGNVLVAGLPDKKGEPGFGSIVTYSRGSGVRAFSPGSDLKEDLAELFGAALDMSFNGGTGMVSLAVGAPRTNGIKDRSKIVGFGAVFVYRMDDNEEWSRIGDPIRSTESLQEAGGEFGGSVALAADVDRVAVGAPSRSKDHNNYNTGGVTVFELEDNNWVAMPSTPLIGEPGSYYGEALDLSNDGNGLIVGGPGRGEFPGGMVDIYKWDSSSKWDVVYSDIGDGTDDMMGSTVAIINEEGTRFAYGIPGLQEGRGAVRVFEESDSDFTQMGEDIVGDDVDEKIGMVLCAKKSRVAVGSQTGILRVYDFTDGAWVPLYNSPNVEEAIVTCAMSDDATAVVVGLANEQVRVFDLITPEER